MDNYQLLLDGEQFQKKYLDLISQAESSIIIHTYIFNDDCFAKKVAELLIQKAKQNVKIELLIDYFGSYGSLEFLEKSFQNKKNISLDSSWKCLDRRWRDHLFSGTGG